MLFVYICVEALSKADDVFSEVVQAFVNRLGQACDSFIKHFAPSSARVNAFFKKNLFTSVQISNFTYLTVGKVPIKILK